MNRRKQRLARVRQARSSKVPTPPRIAYSVETIDRITAERDRALELLDKLELILTRTGSHMAPEDQHTLREARAHLEDAGIRPSTRTLWVDRR